MATCALAIHVITTPGRIVAQESGETPARTDVVEQVEVRLVQIPILARDRHGRPVSDLRPDEIVVKDRGRRMRVAFLDPRVAAPARQEEPVPDVRFFLSAPGGWEGVVDASEAAGSRYAVLFVDVENDQKLRRPDAMQEVIRFVREEIPATYRVAVLYYDGAIGLEVPFTADREAVVSAVQRAYGHPPRPRLDLQARMRDLIRKFEDCAVSTRAFSRVADEACLRAVALEYADEVRPEREDYLDALEGLVRFVSGLKGSKTVLALSHGTPVEPTTEAIEAMRAVFGNTEQVAGMQLTIGVGEGARDRMDRLLDLAVRERVTLHFIDRNTAPAGDFSARLGSPYQPGARPMHAAFTAAQMDLEEMATHTGGTFVHSTDVLRGLRMAMNLERGGYLLGYYVNEYLSPKRLRKVIIGSTRRGVRIVHQRGYYAKRTPEESLRGGIRLGAPLSLEEDGRSGQFVPFKIVVDPVPLGYEAAGDEVAANLTLHFLVHTDGGRSLADAYHFINHAYPRALWDAGDVEPISFNGWVELPPGTYRLVAALRNARTGEGGEVATEVRVPADPPMAPESVEEP